MASEQQQPKEPFVIGTDTWPGVAKLMEECGELMQVLGKLIAYPDGPHPDGTNVIDRLHDELADVEAAMIFLRTANSEKLTFQYMDARVEQKLERFHDWHEGAMAR